MYSVIYGNYINLAYNYIYTCTDFYTLIMITNKTVMLASVHSPIKLTSRFDDLQKNSLIIILLHAVIQWNGASNENIFNNPMKANRHFNSSTTVSNPLHW